MRRDPELPDLRAGRAGDPRVRDGQVPRLRAVLRGLADLRARSSACARPGNAGLVRVPLAETTIPPIRSRRTSSGARAPSVLAIADDHVAATRIAVGREVDVIAAVPKRSRQRIGAVGQQHPAPPPLGQGYADAKSASNCPL